MRVEAISGSSGMVLPKRNSTGHLLKVARQILFRLLQQGRDTLIQSELNTN